MKPHCVPLIEPQCVTRIEQTGKYYEEPLLSGANHFVYKDHYDYF